MRLIKKKYLKTKRERDSCTCCFDRVKNNTESAKLRALKLRRKKGSSEKMQKKNQEELSVERERKETKRNDHNKRVESWSIDEVNRQVCTRRLHTYEMDSNPTRKVVKSIHSNRGIL